MTYFLNPQFEIITADGIRYNLSDVIGMDRIRTVGGLMPENMALSGVSYDTFRPYKADIEKIVAASLTPRAISLQYQVMNSAEYWRHRWEILNIIRPNRLDADGNREMTLVMLLAEKDVTYEFGIKCVVENMPFNPPSDVSAGFVEIARLIAYDPRWFDLQETIIAGAEFTSQRIILPHFLVHYIGPDSVFKVSNINYVGTWKSYPIIEIDAPFDRVRLEHVEASAIIDLNIALTSGTLIIDTAKGTVVDDTTPEPIDYREFIQPGSSFQKFALYPVGELSGNTIKIQLPGFVSSDQITVKYRNYYEAR